MKVEEAHIPFTMEQPTRLQTLAGALDITSHNETKRKPICLTKVRVYQVDFEDKRKKHVKTNGSLIPRSDNFAVQWDCKEKMWPATSVWMPSLGSKNHRETIKCQLLDVCIWIWNMSVRERANMLYWIWRWNLTRGLNISFSLWRDVMTKYMMPVHVFTSGVFMEGEPEELGRKHFIWGPRKEGRKCNGRS